MHRELVVEGDRIIYFPHRHTASFCRWILGIATPVALIAFAFVPISGGPETQAVVLLYGCAVTLAGVAFLVSRTKVTIAFADSVSARRWPWPILGSVRKPIPQAQISAVRLRSERRTNGKGSFWQVWIVDLLRTKPTPGCSLDPRVEKSRWRLPADMDELFAGALAESLAARLDLPLLDTEGVPIERRPKALDQRLGPALLEEGSPARDPGPPPSNMSARTEGDVLTIDWRVNRIGPPLACILLSLGLASMGIWSLVSGGLVVGIFLSAFALLFAWAYPDSLRPHGHHRLVHDGNRVTLELRSGRKQDSLSAEHFEAVRINRYRQTMALITDDKTVECPMTMAQAEWARACLCIHECELAARRA